MRPTTTTYRRDREQDRGGTAANEREGTVQSWSQSWSLHLMKDVGYGSLTSHLELCQGYLYFDSDCLGDLLCFYRKALEAVPRCDSSGRPGKDYCIDPSSPDDNNGAPVPVPWTAPFPVPSSSTGSRTLCRGPCAWCRQIL